MGGMGVGFSCRETNRRGRNRSLARDRIGFDFGVLEVFLVFGFFEGRI